MIHTLEKPLRVQRRESMVRATLGAWRLLSHLWGSSGKRSWVTAVQMDGINRKLEERKKFWNLIVG